MSDKHLRKGDPLPAYNGKYRVFSMRFCPYVERTILVLNAKKLSYEIINVNLEEKPDWLFNFSPRGTVPALEYEQGCSIFDSNIINTYLDEVHPEIGLQASEPLRRARDKMLIEEVADAVSAYYTAVYRTNQLEPSMVKKYHNFLENVQQELVKRGSVFLHDDKPGLVDYTLWPHFERFESLPLLGHHDFMIDRNKYSMLLNYMEKMKNDPAVKPFYLTPEIHVEFTQSRAKGKTNYDMLVN